MPNKLSRHDIWSILMKSHLRTEDWGREICHRKTEMNNPPPIPKCRNKKKNYHDGQEYQNQDWIEFIYWVNQDSVPRFFITSCSISARAHRQNSWWYNTFGTESWWGVYLNEPHVEGSGGRGPLEHSMDLVKDKNFMLALDVLAQDRRYRVSQNTVKTKNTDVNVQCFFLYNLCKYSFIFSNTWYLKMAELMTFLLFCFSISSYYRMVRFKGPDRTTAIV